MLGCYIAAMQLISGIAHGRIECFLFAGVVDLLIVNAGLGADGRLT